TAVCPSGTPTPAPESDDPEPAAPVRRRLSPESMAKVQVRKERRETALDKAIAAVDSGEPLRFLTALEESFAPLRRVDGQMRAPFWRPAQPDVNYFGDMIGSWNWSRPFTGRAVVLDKSGAWVASAASAIVAHGQLERTGEMEVSALKN